MAQLARITSSPDFDTSQRGVDFLRFVVERSLVDPAGDISQYTIAHHVFERGSEFDPTVDPIVRIQAGRVRRSLEHYYLTAGTSDPVLIDLPKGTYRPTFCSQSNLPASEPSDDRPEVAVPWPTLLISPLRNLTGSSDADFIAEGVASDIAAELSRDRTLHVFLASSVRQNARPPQTTRFEMSGTITRKSTGLRLTFHLVDGESREQVWAETFACEDGGGQARCLERAVQSVASAVSEEKGVLSRFIGAGFPQKKSTFGRAYEAILRYQHFDSTNDPQAFREAVTALREAVQIAPDSALSWSYLARLGLTHWSLGIPGEIIPVEQSIAAADRGVKLDPTDVRCRLILCYAHLLTDKVDEASHEAKMALKMNGSAVFWLDSIGYVMTMTGAWEQGTDLLRRAMEINPFTRRASHSAFWVDAIRRDDRTAALAVAQQNAPEAFFWDPLMRAVALVMNDRTPEAAAMVESILRLVPDFPQRGDWLIRRYIKFDSLVERVADYLAQAGLVVQRSRENVAASE